MSIQNPELVTKVTRIIPRANGTEVRITVTSSRSPNMELQRDSYVHKRETPDHEWVLCSDRPHPEWRTMSVDDYNKFGRCDKFQTVSHGEMLSLTSGLVSL